jgi:hypothetical protein
LTGDVPEVDASSRLDAAIVDAQPPPPEAGCDAADTNCTTHVVSCDEVAWCSVPTNVSVLYALTAVWGSGKNDVWAVGSGGTIVHYDGAAWTPTPSGVKNTFYAIWGSGPNDVYTVSDGQIILHGTGFQGASTPWTLVPTPNKPGNTPFVSAVWGSSAQDVRIGGRAFDFVDPVTGAHGTGDRFTLLLDAGTEAGIGWTPRQGTSTIRGIWGSSASDVWMVADNSVYVPYQRALTLHGTPADGGGADADIGDASVLPDPLVWSPVDSQSTVTLESVWGSSASDVWAVGKVGTVRHITSTDDRWQKVPSPTHEGLHAVWGSGPSDVWAVGDAGTILHFDGTSFQPSSAQFPLGLKPALYGVWGSGPDDVWIVGDGIALHNTGPKPGARGGGP